MQRSTLWLLLAGTLTLAFGAFVFDFSWSIVGGIIIAGAVIIGLSALLMARHGASPLQSLGYSSLGDILVNKNFISLVIGVVLSALIVVAAVAFVDIIFYLILPDDTPWIVHLGATAIGVLLSYSLAYDFFKAGQFTVKPGQSAFVSFLNIPLLEMQVGDAWILPRVMQYRIEESQAFVVVADKETFITGNGVSVEAQTSCTVHVKDPLKYQLLMGSVANIELLVKRQLSTKTRQYVARQNVDLSRLGDLESMPANEQWEFIQRITAFKGDFVKNGPEEIRLGPAATPNTGLNKDLEDYGLEVEEGQVQVNQVALPNEIEEAVNRIFKEIFEKVGLTNDARNKAAVANIFNEVFEQHGVKLSDIDEAKRIDIIKENLDRALANEDKAKITALHMRGGGSGVMPILSQT